MTDNADLSDDGGRRLRRVLTDNYAILLGVLLLVGAAGGYLTYTTSVAPAETTETREVSSWESSGEFVHQATVVNGTTALQEGTVLRDRRTYFRSVTPQLDGAFVYQYAASDGGDLSAETTVSLVSRSVETDADGNRTVYWETKRVLGEESASSLAPGDSMRTLFSLNVTEAATEIERIDSEFGGTPGELELVIVARTELSGTRNGVQVGQTRTYRMPITTSGSVYRLQDPGVVVNGDRQTRQVSVPVDYGPLRTAVGPLLLLAGLGGAAGLVYGRRTGWLTVTDHERDRLAFDRARTEFDDWITTARVPADATAPTVVQTDSLAGLVDVAIDTDNRVIEDTERGAFLVIDGDRWFRYDPPTGPVDATESGQPTVDDEETPQPTDDD